MGPLGGNTKPLHVAPQQSFVQNCWVSLRWVLTTSRYRPGHCSTSLAGKNVLFAVIFWRSATNCWPTDTAWTISITTACSSSLQVRRFQLCMVLLPSLIFWCSNIASEDHFEWYNLNWKHIWQLVCFITKREMFMYITLTLNKYSCR